MIEESSLSAVESLPRIGFVGSMNAMPMAYALKFRRDGYDVRYVVEAAPSDVLMRPEHQYSDEVGYPYDDWVVEINRPNSLVHHAVAPLFFRRAITLMKDRDVVFLNDYGIALAPYLSKRAVSIVISSGSDIDVYCSYEAALAAARTVRRRALYPVRLVCELLRTFHQRRGLRHCKAIFYFPRGLNPRGDDLLRVLTRETVTEVYERYDVNFRAAGIVRTDLRKRNLKNVLVPVRINMQPPSHSKFEYKGNDLIIRALGRYAVRNPNIEIHMFEKGPLQEIELARTMIKECGLESNVIWHEPVPLSQLMKLYEECDVCFDQVGSHWMGAIGCYALYAGRPVIANARLDVFRSLWGEDPPILHATTEDEVFSQLVRCEDFSYRTEIAEAGHEFAARRLDTESVFQRLRQVISDTWHRPDGPGSDRAIAPSRLYD
jgi:hypothetical protein